MALAKLIRKARRDRRSFNLGHDAEGRPASVLTDPRLAAALAEPLFEQDGPGETTHHCAMDADGNVVSMTQSIERCFGSKVATPSLGFLYNGYMKAFKVQNKKHPYYLRPGIEARSNASPTIAFRGNQVLAVGCTGSERMASAIFTTWLHLRSRSPFESVAAPRLHATPESLCLVEGDRVDPAHQAALEREGFELERLDEYAFKMGGLHLALRNGDTYVGVADPRRDGAAFAP